MFKVICDSTIKMRKFDFFCACLPFCFDWRTTKSSSPINIFIIFITYRELIFCSLLLFLFFFGICCCSVQEIQKLKNDKHNMGLQRSMWLDLNTLLSVKIECHRDALEAGSGGTLSVNKGAETFTLS